MGCDTVFRRLVHLKGPDLDLEGLAVGADQRGVQRLVHVLLGHGDVILEPARNGLIHLMDHTQGCITVLHRVHQDPNSKQIVNLIQRLILVHHFFINTEKVLDSSVYLGLDARIGNMGADLFHDPADKGLPLALLHGDLFHQIIVDLRLQIF